jgi:quercetin dioxygenase-like cupin family protein
VTGATIELAKVEKGAEFPEHYHTTVQTLFLVSGRLRTRGRLITPGTFNIIPAGELHGPFLAEEESIQFKYFSGVPVYILRDGHCFIYKEDGRTLDGGRLTLGEALKSRNIVR